MVLVHSFDEVRAYISNIRSLRKGFITNFFPEQRKIEIWLSHNRLFVEVADGVVLFFNVDDGLYNIYGENKKYIGIGIVENNLLKRDVVISEE